MHATPNQVINMWHRIHTELDSFGSELVVRRLANKNDENCTRLPVYKEDLEGLRVGNWVGNTVIDVFAWKTIKRLDTAGVSESWIVLSCIICMSNMKDTIKMDAVIW
jgi:hypothetical protein